MDEKQAAERTAQSTEWAHYQTVFGREWRMCYMTSLLPGGREETIPETCFPAKFKRYDAGGMWIVAAVPNNPEGLELKWDKAMTPKEGTFLNKAMPQWSGTFTLAPNPGSRGEKIPLAFTGEYVRQDGRRLTLKVTRLN